MSRAVEHITDELAASKPYYKRLAPGPGKVLRGKPKLIFQASMKGVGVAKKFRRWRKGEPVSVLAGESVGNKIIDVSLSKPQELIMKAHGLSARVYGSSPSRSWITKPGQYPMIMVFHDASRAGPHVDIHIGRLSVIYRVKPDVYATLKYNRSGRLTEASKAALIDHVRSEIANGSRVPQNLDHTPTNAAFSWVEGEGPEEGEYGAGKTRQVISSSTVEVYKAYKDGPIEFYAPALIPYRGTYLYQLYPGTDKRAPILVWGLRQPNPPEFNDRLHLKLVHPHNVQQELAKMENPICTTKYDGASCYLVVTPKGTTAWSPRTSARTGQQIEYTYKLPGLAAVTDHEKIVAMGEVLFFPRSKLQREKREYLSAADIGGILNSNEVLSHDLDWEIRLYRIDSVGRKSTSDLPYEEMRVELSKLSMKDPNGHLRLPQITTLDKAFEGGHEGLVCVSRHKPLSSAIKVKWWGDENDWRIDEINLEPGPKGRGDIAGTVTCTSLDSGKKFKLGPGQLGDRELSRKIMAEPDLWKGTVLKVSSRQGHEGRAAKVIMIHPDKGTAPLHELNIHPDHGHNPDWSARVTRESDALDLEEGVFTWDDPVRIAESLKRSADKSHRRKSGAFRSAMSMLNFYINRAGKNLDPAQEAVLDQAKDELRAVYGKPRQNETIPTSKWTELTLVEGAKDEKGEETDAQGEAE